MAAQEELIKSLKKNYDRKLFAVEVLSPVFGSLLEVYSSLQRPAEQPNNTESKVIEDVGIYGRINLEDDVEVLCYEIILKDHVRIDQSKVAIQHYVRKLLTSGQAALINFVSPTYTDMWRFTLVAKDSELTSKGIQEKATHPKRYTFLVESGRNNKTFAERMEWLSLESDKTMESLVEAFSVEKMSNAFFDEYKEHYQNFVQYLTGKRMVKKGSKWQEEEVSQPSAFLKSIFNGNEKDARDFCKKLLGRIVFLYFVQKKRWLGASDTDYEDGSQNFVFEIFDETGGDERFFPHGLTELFFNALNKERPDDLYETPGGREVRIPYLNGGLFTRDEVDELLHKKGDTMIFPYKLFSNEEKKEDPLPKNASVETDITYGYRGFLDFLNAFNFTVYEDSQDDHTVAIDPEMLGHIFENLLEDNKDKGAYYTPKEIVNYMCQESLLEYLNTHLSADSSAERHDKAGLGDKTDKEKLGQLVRDKEPNHLSKEVLKAVNEKLDDVKICDPAIGSGAFPMGLLQEIFSIKEIIAYHIDLPWNPAKTKEDIIQNSIYGVDIEKGAVDIARLRFWLSLVVDKDKPKALPNLDYKIVVGNSLIPKFNGETIEIEWERKESVGAGKKHIQDLQKTLNEVSNKQKKFFDPHLKDKKKTINEIRNLKLDALINQVSFNKERYQNSTEIKGGFAPSPSDIRHNNDRNLTIKEYDNRIQKLRRIKNDESIDFEHFDWKLDFPEILNHAVTKRYGFDILIGNPPYLRVQGIRDKYPVDVDFFLNRYVSATGRFDLYALFTEKSFSLLSDDGVLNFIQPDKWINSDFGRGLRDKLSKNVNKLISFSQTQVFNVSTYSSLIWINSKQVELMKYHGITHELNTERQIREYLSSLDESKFSKLETKEFGEEPWMMVSNDENEIMTLLKACSRKVSDVFSNVSQGIVSVGDDLFILEGEIKNSIFTGFSHQTGSNVEIESDILKPMLRGDDVSKYKPLMAKAYVIYPHHEKDGKTLPYEENEFKRKFPLTFKYFEPYKDQLIKKKIKYKTNPKYWYALHRSRDLSLFRSEKLVTPEISQGTNLTIDTEGLFHNTQVYSFVKKVDEDYGLDELLAILNSNVAWFYLKSTGAVLRGGYFRFKTKYLEPFPIPDINEIVRKKIGCIVNYILFLNRSSDRTDFNKLIPVYFDQVLNGIVYELYFPDLLKKHERQIIQHLGELPALKDSMSDPEKLEICKKVFERLDNKEHPVRNNIFYMDSILEIRIIEGKDEDH